MKIYFNKCHFHRRLIHKIFDYTLFETGNLVPNCYVSLSFVNEKEIKKLNSEHRKVNKSTDVLSFPMLEISYKQKLKEFDYEREPDGGLNLGDIVICTKIAKQQAKIYKNSYKREFCFLALHGLLHLLGYDHIEKEEEKMMMDTAEKVLENFNIKRGLNV